MSENILRFFCPRLKISRIQKVMPFLLYQIQKDPNLYHNVHFLTHFMEEILRIFLFAF